MTFSLHCRGLHLLGLAVTRVQEELVDEKSLFQENAASPRGVLSSIISEWDAEPHKYFYQAKRCCLLYRLSTRSLGLGSVSIH